MPCKTNLYMTLCLVCKCARIRAGSQRKHGQCLRVRPDSCPVFHLVCMEAKWNMGHASNRTQRHCQSDAEVPMFPLASSSVPGTFAQTYVEFGPVRHRIRSHALPFSLGFSGCLSHCLVVILSTCLLACVLTCLSVCLFVRLSIWTLAFACK